MRNSKLNAILLKYFPDRLMPIGKNRNSITTFNMIIDSTPWYPFQLTCKMIDERFFWQLAKHGQRYLSFTDLHHFNLNRERRDCYIFSSKYAFLTHARYLPMAMCGLCRALYRSSASSAGQMSRVRLHTPHW